MRYEGSRATLRGKFAYGMDDAIEIHDHRSGAVEQIDLSGAGGVTGHGGGDEGVMRAFVRAVRGEDVEGLTTARESLKSHLMAFAADRARLEGRVVAMDALRRALAE